MGFLWTCFSVVLQFALLSIVWSRDQGNDRRSCVGHMPMLGAGILHIWLWLVVSEGDTESECSSRNRQLSFLMGVNLMAIPMGFSYRAYLGMIGSRFPNGSFMLKQEIVQLKSVTIFWWSATVLVLAVAMHDGMWPSCTTLGPNGNQIFASILFPELVSAYKPLRYILWYFFGVLTIKAFNVSPRPDTTNLLLILWEVLAIIFFVFFHNEWTSVWINFSFLLCVGYAIGPLKIEQRWNISIPCNNEPMYLAQEERMAEESKRMAEIEQKNKKEEIPAKDVVISIQP